MEQIFVILFLLGLLFHIQTKIKDKDTGFQEI